MNCPEVHDKLYDLLFDLLDEPERREVEAHLAACPACRAARDAASRERDLLQRWTVPPPPPGLAEAVAGQLTSRGSETRGRSDPLTSRGLAARGRLDERKVDAMKYEPVEPEVRWLGSRRFWQVAAAAAALVVAGLIFQWQRLARMTAPPQEAFLYGQSEMAPGLPAVWRLYVRNGATARPIAGAEVHARLVGADGRDLWAGAAATGSDGTALLEPDLPADAPEGACTLHVGINSPDGASSISEPVAVRRSFRVMVSTDKPLYQPGQVIHVRSLALANADLRPVANRAIVIEARDPKGNKVFKKATTTSDFGTAAADFELADQVNLGDYTLAATLGDTASERTVRVERYVLPKFKIELSADRGYYEPGETIRGDLAADYTFGKPVAGGKAVIVASEFVEKLRPFATVEGTTDADGRFHFEIPLKDRFVGQELKKGDAFVSLEATVTDLADHAQKKTLDLTVTATPIRIELFPESGTLVRGVENILYIVTAYPDGRPAKTKLTIAQSHQVIETSELGIAAVKITPPVGSRPVGSGRVGSGRVGSPAFTRSSEEPPKGGTPNEEPPKGGTPNEEPPKGGTPNGRPPKGGTPNGRPPNGRPPKGGTPNEEPPEGGTPNEEPPEGGTPNGMALTVIAEDAKGVKVSVTRDLRVGERSESILLRTDKAVYRSGETANITLLSADRAGRAFLDVVKDRRAALTKAVEIQDGRGELALDIPPDLFGTLELHAYRIMADGGIVRDSRLVQVARADDLTIEATLDKAAYRPAERALLKLAVTRRDGEPTAAALSLAGVDEAVFALSEMRPGLERVYFALQEELLKPRYEICAHAPIAPAEALQPRPELEEASAVLFSAAEAPAPPKSEASESFRQKQDQLRGAMAGARAEAVDGLLLLPFTAFVAAAAALVGYAVLKLFRRRPFDAAPFDELAAFRRALRAANIWWILGAYLPILGALVGAIVVNTFRWRGYWTEQTWIILFGAFPWLAVLGGLLYSARRLRRCPPSHAFPFLRKAAWTLPLAYVLAWAAFLGIIEAVDYGRYRGLVGDDEAILLVIVLMFLVPAIAGAWSIAGNSAVRRVSLPRCLWLGVSRTALAGGLLAVGALLPVLASGGAAARMAPSPMVMDLSMAKSATSLRSLGVPLVEYTSESIEGGARPAPVSAPPRIRRFFPETLLWQPELITDEQGRAQLEVPLADSITTWRLAMSAVSKRGELGAATAPLRVFQDFFVDIDFPVALTQHDLVSVPVAVYNYLDVPQEVRLEVEEAPWFALRDSASKSLRIGPKQVTSVPFTIEARRPGAHKLVVKAQGSQMADAVERAVRVVPDGREVVETANGRLSENLTREIAIPDEAIEGASDLVVKIYPNSFSQVVEGLESIFAMPHGCFEQTSSTTYPNILVLDYLRRTRQAKPEVEMKALHYIALGGQRLLSFEVDGGGFDWYGKGPADTVLSAYGLMEFADMAKVAEVDPAVLARTRQWLLGRQRDDGTWLPGRAGMASGYGPQPEAPLRTTAYVAWAIGGSGDANAPLSRALDYLATQGAKSRDPYTLALCANALLAARPPRAAELVERLQSLKQEKDGLAWWTSAAQGVTYSRGGVLDIETTALAASALLQAGQHADTAHKALAWLITQKDPRGTWHSTQATVLAMRALLAATGPGGKVEGDVHVTVAANGKLAKELAITPETSDVFRLISLRDAVRKGRNTVALETAGKGDLAYQIVATHYLPWPAEPPKEARKELSIEVAYDATTLKTGDLLACRATVAYNGTATANMTIVDLGIPPGFEVLPDGFEALKAKGLIERYTVAGRQVIVYLRELRSGQPLVLEYRLRAKFPITAKTPPSTVYQYYQPTLRDTARPVLLNVM